MGRKIGNPLDTGFNRRTMLERALATGGGVAVGLMSGALAPLSALAARASGPGGFSLEGLNQITAAMKESVDRGDVAGVVTMIYRHGQIAYTNAVGWQDEETKVPLRRDSLFRIASMTKPVVAVAILMLIDEGKLRLTDRVDKFLPELADPKVLRSPTGSLEDTYPSPHPITVVDLLTHRSGLTYPGGIGGSVATLEAALSKDFNPAVANAGADEWIKKLGTFPLKYEPGTHWNYGLSFDVLGILVQRVSGMPLADFLHTRIFEPLAMKDTGFWVAKEKLDRLATNYALDTKTGKRITIDPAGHSKLASPPAFASGGGGLVSTADDYMKFARMLLEMGRLGDTRIVSRESVALMTTNFLPPDQRTTPIPGQGFGLGVSIVDDVPKAVETIGYASKGSYSWPGIFGTWWQADPQEDMVSILMIQLAGGYMKSPLLAFSPLVYKAIED